MRAVVRAQRLPDAAFCFLPLLAAALLAATLARSLAAAGNCPPALQMSHAASIASQRRVAIAPKGPFSTILILPPT